jgi:nucleoside permease NupC
LLPLAGLIALIFIGFLFSKHRGHVDWTTVATGFATQITIGLLTIRWSVGRSIVQAMGQLAEKFFSFAYIGAEVTYGHELIDNYGVFAFKVGMMRYCNRFDATYDCLMKFKIKIYTEKKQINK